MKRVSRLTLHQALLKSEFMICTFVKTICGPFMGAAGDRIAVVNTEYFSRYCWRRDASTGNAAIGDLFSFSAATSGG